MSWTTSVGVYDVPKIEKHHGFFALPIIKIRLIGGAFLLCKTVPTFPTQFELSRTVIKRLISLLETKFLKDVNVDTCKFRKKIVPLHN
jgi:hypothetical protein